jgi:arylsulfatase A-like enzyme
MKVHGGEALRGRRAILLGGLLAIASACSQPDTVLEPVKRLEQEITPAVDGNLDCEIGGEFRPSIGCIRPRPLRNERRTVEPDGRIRFELLLPPLARPHLVEFRIWGRGDIETFESKAFFVPGGQKALAVDEAVAIRKPGEEVVVGSFAYELPPAASRELTRTMPIRKDSVLDLGIGLAPIAVRAGASPAEFRLIAVDETGERHELLSRTIAPEESGVWHDERIDLARFAGRRIQLAFETVIRPALGADPTRSFTLGLWGGPKLLEPRPLEGRFDLVLISLDTLRADLVGSESEIDGEPVTPELDAIAAEGTSFTDVMTTYPSTSAAHMSLFTGTFPKLHGVTFPTNALPDTIATLPQILAAHGFATAAVTEGGMLAAQSGFRRGFDSYREFSGTDVWKSPRQVERTFAAGVDWVERHPDERFFLFLHTYQVHSPYTPPPEFMPSRAAKDSPTPGRDRYEAEVRYTDSEVGALMQKLERAGALDRAIVVITSDHGEEFSEHGGVYHARTVYDEVMRVPLIFWGPGAVPEGRVLSAPASLVDVLPTLLELAGLPPEVALQGKSLVPAMRGESRDDARIRFGEGPARKSDSGSFLVARDRNHKWIARSKALAESEIYDLGSDPGEQRPLDDPALRARGVELFGEFDALMDRGGKHDKPAERELDEETESKLRALGYLE